MNIKIIFKTFIFALAVAFSIHLIPIYFSFLGQNPYKNIKEEMITDYKNINELISSFTSSNTIEDKNFYFLCDSLSGFIKYNTILQFYTLETANRSCYAPKNIKFPFYGKQNFEQIFDVEIPQIPGDPFFIYSNLNSIYKIQMGGVDGEIGVKNFDYFKVICFYDLAYWFFAINFRKRSNKSISLIMVRCP